MLRLWLYLSIFGVRLWVECGSYTLTEIISDFCNSALEFTKQPGELIFFGRLALGPTLRLVRILILGLRRTAVCVLRRALLVVVLTLMDVSHAVPLAHR